MKCKCAKCGKETEIVCFVDDEPWCEECLDKALGTPPKHITNYDRLISKSPEELAEVIRNPCDMGIYMPNEWCNGRNCGFQCSLDWLKQEAET